MALQILDYASKPLHTPSFSGVSDILPNILRGYEIQKAPAKMAEEQRKLELANALAEIQNRYEEPKLQAHIAQMRASAQNAGGGGSLQGHARNVQDLVRLLNDPNIPDEQKQLAKALFEADLGKSNTLIDTRQQNMKYKPVGQLTTDEKAKMFGQFSAMGIGNSDALELYSNGITPELLAAYKQQNPQASNHEAVAAIVGQLQGGHGYGLPQPQVANPPVAQPINPQVAPEQAIAPLLPQTPQPLVPADTRNVPIQPAMTGSNRTDYNNVKGALAEENYIHPIITEAMKPYAKKYGGYSPKQFLDTFKGDKDVVDKMAKFYAARALQPEIAGIRSRMAGGSNAAQALHDIQVQALNKIDVMDWRVSPEAYAKAQDYISKWMTGMTNARLNAMSGQISPSHTNISNANAESGSKKLFGNLQLEDDGSR